MNGLDTLRITHYSGKLTLAAVVLLYAVGCDSSPRPEPPPSLEEVSYTAHVAFAGGGWRAHTGHAGWTMSLLNYSGKNLNDAFANVGTVSSNSGGSWFSTMLTYSDSFVTAIEAPDAISAWPISGWLGRQQHLFDQASCHLLSGDAFTACVFEAYASEGATHWSSVVEDLVFKDYPVEVLLSGTRQPWAQGKPLLLAATMLTTEAVLGEEDDGDEQYYQACLPPSTPVLNGDSGASCSGGSTPDVTPVTFSSLPSGSPLTAPPFLPAAQADTNASHFTMGYTEAAWREPATANTTIQNPLTSDHVAVMIAAAASSAATGFGASHVVTGDWEESYEASDEALSFQLTNSDVAFVDVDGNSVQALADQKVVQIADGGPTDNSGVAQIVRFLQLNNQADGFHIVAFDNVQALYMPGGTAANVGVDIANLFGKGLWQGDQYCSGPDGTGVCITVPSLQIFEADTLASTEVTWRASDSDNRMPNVVHELIYTKYEVVTVANLAFGVKAGTKGTLHAFTCAWSGAATAPQNNTKDGDFKAYADMLNFIHVGLQNPNAKGQTGLKYLLDALGLNQ